MWRWVKEERLQNQHSERMQMEDKKQQTYEIPPRLPSKCQPSTRRQSARCAPRTPRE